MSTPSPSPPTRSTPTFYVTARQPLRPAAVLLALLLAAGVLTLVSLGLGHSRAMRWKEGRPSATRTPGDPGRSANDEEDDKDDDPSQVDTIVLGDAADAPVPARKHQRISNVHATVIVRLPRYGEQVGLIPDTPVGHLLYGWLAAFNQGSSAMLDSALPSAAPDMTAAAQMVLRQQTGGFQLLSAKEVQPGVLVFRLRDQTPAYREVLGTLQMRPQSNPPAIASFSLRAVLPAEKPVGTANGR